MISILIIKATIDAHTDDDENLRIEIKTLLTVLVLVPFLTFIICIFAIRFYMIWEVNAFDKQFSFITIFLNCLKFWYFQNNYVEYIGILLF